MRFRNATQRVSTAHSQLEVGVGVGWGGDEAEIFCGVSSEKKKLYRKVACANTEL